MSAGIAQGYKKGFATIVDANIVTLLVAFILFILATAGVKGFAFVLGVGTHGLAVHRGARDPGDPAVAARHALLQHPSALGAGKQRKPITFDFMGASRWFFSMSGVILLVCTLAIGANGLNFGIDFESGTRITAALEKPATVEQVRDAIAPAGFADAKIQTIDNEELGPNVVQISDEVSGKTDAGHGRARQGVRRQRRAGGLRDRADVRRVGRELRADRDHRVADASSRSTSRCASSGSSPCRC